MNITKGVYCALLFGFLFFGKTEASAPITLLDAVTKAQKNDLWLRQSHQLQQALNAEQVAAGTWQDPQLSLSVNNLPSHSLSLTDDNMSQLKMSITQALPRGDSLQINQRILDLKSQQHPLLRADRQAKVAQYVSELWLDAYAASMTITLIEQDAHLFEQLVEVSEANYSSALGQTRQHDVIRAQLELARLQDRLEVQKQQLAEKKAALLKWLTANNQRGIASLNVDFILANQMPDKSIFTNIPSNINQLTPMSEAAIQQLKLHPVYLAKRKLVEAGAQAIELAEQKYKPQWGLNASYGYRDNDGLGNARDDLLSFGVSLDLPVFTDKRQDQGVISAKKRREAQITEQLLLLKELASSLAKEQKSLGQLNRRFALYKTTILEQSHQQAEAALSAYNNDDGDFNTAVQAKITELDTRIVMLNIQVNTFKTLARINYYFAKSDNPELGITMTQDQP